VDVSVVGAGQRRTLSDFVQLACWLLPPSRFKNGLLNRFGHEIALTARIGPTIATGVRKFHIGEHARIALFNVFKDLSSVWLDDYAIIESWNWISAHPAFQETDPNAGTLFMGVRAKIGSRSYFDCSGTVTIRAFGNVGGNRCLFQTHQTDFAHNRQSVGRITVGDHSFVGSCAVMLKGTSLPDRSILAAHSSMTASVPADQPGLYAGTPAVWKHGISGSWFTRTNYFMTENVVDEPMGIDEDDLSMSKSYRGRVINASRGAEPTRQPKASR
jgi:acetyltransferase-like isoleucine patch superfamily enzyme